MGQVLKQLSSNPQLKGTFQSLPFEWTNIPNIGRRITITPTDLLKNRKSKYYIYISACLILLQSICSHYFIPETSHKNGYILRVWISNVLLFVVTIYWHICHLAKIDMATSINGLTQYDEIYPKPNLPFSKKPLFEKVCEMAIHLVQFTSTFTIPIGCVFVLPWGQPLKLSLVAYWPFELIYNTAPNNLIVKFAAFVGKLSSLALNYWIWIVIMQSSTFVYANLLMSAMLAHKKNMHQFQKRCGRRLYDRKTRAENFRHLQYLAHLSSVAIQGYVQFFVNVTPCILGSLCATLFIQNMAKTSHTNDTTVLIVMCGFILMDCIVSILFFTGFMSSIYVLSDKIIGEMKSQTKVFDKWERRFYGSCRPFKFVIAQGTFVDRQTPLVSLDHMFSYSVQLLLLDL